MRAERESDIQRAVLEYLGLLRWSVWRFNSGGARLGPDGRFVRFSTARGCSDLIAIAPGGRFVAIEVKRPGNSPTALQAAWLAEVRAAGGLALVATSAADLARQLREEGYDAP